MARKSSKKTAPEQEKPKFDDARYGEVLYSYSFDLDNEKYFNASGLVGTSRLQQIYTIASMACLLLIILSLYDREHPIYPIAIVCFILFVGGSIAYNRSVQIRDRYVSKSTLAQTDDKARHVVVTPEKIVVEGPGDTVSEYSLSEVKKVAEDEDGALAKLGGRRYVYVPRKALSESRFNGLVKLLREKHA